MKIKRSHLKYLIERYLFEETDSEENEETDSEENELSSDTNLNDYVTALKNDDKKSYSLPDETKKTLGKITDTATAKKIADDENTYNEKTFTKEYGALATAAINKGLT